MPYDDDYPTPTEVIRGHWRWLPAWTIVLATLLVVGGLITWGGSEFGWWLNGQAATHQAKNTQNGYANQTTLRAQVTSQLAQVTTITTQIAEAGSDASLVTALKAQRMSIAGIVCSDASEVTDGPLPADQSQWAAANCANGSVSPTSPLYQAGQP
jgi:hypothetical protein